MTNVKGRLQELLMARHFPVPKYGVQTSGPTHCLTLRCTVTVQWEGQSLSEVVEQQGGKKKDVEKLAAAKMLRRLQGDVAVADTLQELEIRSPVPRQSVLPSVSSSVGSPVPRQSHISPSRCAVSSTRSPSPRSGLRSPSPKSVNVNVTSSKAVGSKSPIRLGSSSFVRNTSVSPNVSSLLHVGPRSSPSIAQCQSPISILQERLQSMQCPLPSYTNEPAMAASSPNQVFRTQCTISNRLREPVLKTEGYGHSKQQAKEEAAQKMLEKVGEKVEDMKMGLLSPLTTGSSSVKAGSECLGVVDPELDEELASRLSPLLPQYHTWHEDLQVKCLAWTLVPRNYPVAGHGVGETETVAKREASCNLLSNLAELNQLQA